MNLSKKYKSGVLICSVIILLIVISDQLTKSLLLASVGLHNSVAFIPGVLSITLVQNTGGAFSFLKEFPFIFKIAGIINLLIFSYIVFCPTVNLDYIFKLGGALILSGTVGNLIDRFFRSGVIDFLDLELFEFAIFNLADISVDAGVVLILTGFIWSRKQK